MAWSDWYQGVMVGISAPVNSVTEDVAWAWSNAESGADVMRWNNPLNTIQELPRAVDPDMNSVGVEAYSSVADGITATVATLLNDRYSTIIDHFRRSVPRAQWADCCAELGVWGTGCGWLTAAYGAAPGVIVAAEEMPYLFHDVDGGGIWEVGAAGKRLISSEEWSLYQAAVPPVNAHDAPGAFLATIPAVMAGIATGAVDLAPVLNALAALKADLDVVASDVATVKMRVEKDLAP